MCWDIVSNCQSKILFCVVSLDILYCSIIKFTWYRWLLCTFIWLFLFIFSSIVSNSSSSNGLLVICYVLVYVYVYVWGVVLNDVLNVSSLIGGNFFFVWYLTSFDSLFDLSPLEVILYCNDGIYPVFSLCSIWSIVVNAHLLFVIVIQVLLVISYEVDAPGYLQYFICGLLFISQE